ncbi:hypothetical protein F2Q68_00000665 [Brassica cretica]|uniref:Uncharacterized protein n=1 Tax=Brassica cretica TaxID=69181 RepID=A0A8S9JLM3_BRACR|nr:hypothetical protein F2Q68_00000665 [Brassica cretica]
MKKDETLLSSSVNLCLQNHSLARRAREREVEEEASFSLDPNKSSKIMDPPDKDPDTLKLPGYPIRPSGNASVHAPVSDREYKATLPETPAMIDLAANMIKEGRAEELMPREADPSAPISAYRYHSLCAYMGDDDIFSSDLSDDQLKTRLGHMANTPCQVIFSMGDEYVPDYVNKKALVNRLSKAMGGAEKVEVEHGNHSLSNRVHEAVQAIMSFVTREGPSGWDDPWS